MKLRTAGLGAALRLSATLLVLLATIGVCARCSTEIQEVVSDRAFSCLPVPEVRVGAIDTLAAIADRHNTRAENIRAANPQASLPANATTPLPSGLALALPGGAPVPPLPTTVEVTSAHELLAFARAYGIPVRAIGDSNPGVAKITGATLLRVPALPLLVHAAPSPPQPCTAGAVCVRAGQTLEDVANELYSTAEELLAANPHLASRQASALFVGQALAAPGGATTLPTQVRVPVGADAYGALLATPGVPLEAAYLTHMAAANGYVSAAAMLAAADSTRILTAPRLSEAAAPLLPPSCEAMGVPSVAAAGGSGAATARTLQAAVPQPLSAAAPIMQWAEHRRRKILQYAPPQPPPPKSENVVPVWGQCGGAGGDCEASGVCVAGPWPGFTCAGQAACVDQNEWYSQCLPPSQQPNGTPPPKAPTPPKAGPGNVVPIWGQCGGAGGDCEASGVCVAGPWPGFTCVGQAACVDQNEWYSQCLPPSQQPGGTPPPKAPTPPKAGGPGTVVAIWGQCGGLGADCGGARECGDAPFPGFACQAGTTCQRLNEWYWQCL